MDQPIREPAAPTTYPASERASLTPLTARAAIPALGAILLGAGLVLVFLRRGTGLVSEPWGDFSLFLVLTLAAALLYGAAMRALPDSPDASGESRPWLVVSLIFGALLIPAALNQGILIFDDTPGLGLNLFWTFGLAAAAAYAGWRRHGVRAMVLLAGAFVLVAWLGLWDELLSDGLNDQNGVRVVLLLVGAALVAAGFRLPSARPGAEPTDLVTVGGLALVAGCVADRSLAAALVGFGEASISTFWLGALLIVSLGLLVLGARGPIRGPAYVGALGLGTFLFGAGLQISEADIGDRTGSLMGWPIILLIAGIGALAYSHYGDPDRRR